MYAPILFQKMMESNDKKTFILAHKNNEQFIKLVSLCYFTFNVTIPVNNNPVLLQRNTVDEFYSLCINCFTNYIDFSHLYSRVDKVSYLVYNYILTNSVKLPFVEGMPYHKIRKFKKADRIIEGTVVEQHKKGKKICIIKHGNNIILKGKVKYYKDTALEKALLKTNLKNFVWYGFKTQDKISLYDIEMRGVTQIERFKALAKQFYQNEKKLIKYFTLPIHMRQNYTFSEDYIYLVKTEEPKMLLHQIGEKNEK